MRAPQLDTINDKDIFLDGQHLDDLTENGKTIVNFQTTSTSRSNLHHIRFMARNGVLHSTKGPAYIQFVKNGCNNQIVKQTWHDYGKLHNTKGPALIEYDNDGNVSVAEYYLNHKKVCSDYFKNPYYPTDEELFMMLLGEQ